MIESIQERLDEYQNGKRYSVVLLSVFKEPTQSFDGRFYGSIKYKIIDNESTKTKETWNIWIYGHKKLSLEENHYAKFAFDLSDKEQFLCEAKKASMFINCYSCYRDVGGKDWVHNTFSMKV